MGVSCKIFSWYMYMHLIVYCDFFYPQNAVRRVVSLSPIIDAVLGVEDMHRFNRMEEEGRISHKEFKDAKKQCIATTAGRCIK